LPGAAAAPAAAAAAPAASVVGAPFAGSAPLGCARLPLARLLLLLPLSVLLLLMLTTAARGWPVGERPVVVTLADVEPHKSTERLLQCMRSARDSRACRITHMDNTAITKRVRHCEGGCFMVLKLHSHPLHQRPTRALSCVLHSKTLCSKWVEDATATTAHRRVWCQVITIGMGLYMLLRVNIRTCIRISEMCSQISRCPQLSALAPFCTTHHRWFVVFAVLRRPDSVGGQGVTVGCHLHKGPNRAVQPQQLLAVGCIIHANPQPTAAMVDAGGEQRQKRWM
jgi:hypothetical protein